MAKLLQGKAVAEALMDNLKLQVNALREKGTIPKLAILRVGENPGDMS